MNAIPHVNTVGVQRADHVYQSLLSDIMSGHYRPGQQLVIDDIAGGFGVSITPVRDALTRLEGQGVVIRMPYTGSFVRSFDVREIEELYEVRAGLEVTAAGLAAVRINAEQLDRLRSYQRDGEEARHADDLDRYQRSNLGFHATIFEAARNRLLVRTMESIKIQMQMMIAQTIKVPGRPGRASREHLELVELLTAGDAHGAEVLMRAHVYSALDDLRAKPPA